jgi:zinc and cadmium transporter
MPVSFQVITFAFAAGFCVSLVSLSGIFALWIKPIHLKRLIPVLVALAVGVLLGDAFIHLIPDAVTRQGSVADVCLTTLLGIFLFFLLEKLVRWHHDHTVPVNEAVTTLLPLAKMNLIGDGIHNFIDGILIAGSFLVAPELGLSTTLAIIAHEIPQEIGDVGALLRGGLPPAKAVFFNFLCSLTVILGVGLTLLLGQMPQSALILLLPIAAGGFIYIAASDFIPVLHENCDLPSLSAQCAAFAIGIGFMQFIIILEQLLQTV